MIATILGLVAAAAAVSLLVRALRDRRTARLAPGGSPESALSIARFGEIDAAVALQQCRCGGRFDLRGEGPVAGAAQLRRTIIECRECGRERSLYFDMTAVEHALGDG